MSELLTLIVLVSVVLTVLSLKRLAPFSPLFRITPVPFWCYFLPMILATIGVLPRDSSLYPLLSRQLLPICLVFLLIGTDLRALTQLGKTAMIAMLTGSAGILIGTLLSFLLFHRWLPKDSWMGFGALTATWIGGSVNMLAVKESIGIPDSIFAPLVIVDAFLAYSWMGILIAASGWQEKWDNTIGTTQSCHPERSAPKAHESKDLAFKDKILRFGPFRASLRMTPLLLRVGTQIGLAMTIFLFLIIALFISFFSQWLGSKMPVAGGLFTPYTWTVLLVTTSSLFLSLTSLSRFTSDKTTKFGYFLLFLLLTSIGAKVDIRAIVQAPLFLAAGAVLILIHASILALAGRFLRIPLFFLATASQANIGGPASAPIVAAVYQPQLASVGLLMAILGNVMGTYLGLLSAWVCRFLAR